MYFISKNEFCLLGSGTVPVLYKFVMNVKHIIKLITNHYNYCKMQNSCTCVCCTWLDWLSNLRSMVLVGPYCCVDRPTFLVGLYGPTWLLCVAWQIHYPGWSWWSDLTAMCGLTDPLSWLVLMVWLDCSVWTDRSTVQSSVLVGPNGLLDCSAWADKSTVLVGPEDDLTWLLLYGLTDPLSWLVLRMIWLDCSVWACGWH